MFEFRPQSFKVRSRPAYAKIDLPPEVRRAEKQRARYERKIERAFFDYLDAVTSDDALDQIAAMYRNGDLMGMVHFPDPYIREFAGIIREVFIGVGDEETEHLLGQLNIRLVDEEGSPVTKIDMSASIDITFNPGQAGAAAFLRQSELQFIREITRAQREVIRKAMSEALNSGMGYVEASRLFKNEIGLTAFQQNAVRNYRRLLERNSGQALTRVLRDRRYDPSISRAIRTGSPLSTGQIDKMSERYRQRMLAMRAETIARTEGQAAVNAARHHSTSQMLQKAGIQESDMERKWHTIIDGRERATHHAMNGQVRGMSEKFKSPSGAQLLYPGDRSAPAAEVINCRCVLETRFKPEAEASQVSVAQPPVSQVPVGNPTLSVADDIYRSPSTSLFPQAAQNIDVFLPEIAAAQKQTVKQVTEQLERKLKGLVRDAEVFVRVPGDSKILDDIVQSGKVKNRFEAGVKSTDLLQGTRLKEEYNLFGLAQDAPASSRPIYGYVTSYNNGQPGRALVNNYGNVAFKLKRTKRPHITITGGDSLRGEYRPSPLNNPSLESFDARRVLKTRNIEDAAMEYVEAHIGKGLSLDDIDEVIFFESRRRPNLVYEQFKPVFEKLGIRVRLISEVPRTLPFYESTLSAPLKPKKGLLPSGFTHEQQLFRAAWADTAESLEIILKDNLASGKKWFTASAEKKAFNGVISEAKKIVRAIDSGNRSAAVSALTRALKFSDDLEVLRPEPKARLFTQWIRSAARRHKI